MNAPERGRTDTAMKRICVIGDSHAAALKTGWNALATEYAGVTLTFFAAMSQLMEALSLVDRELVATTNTLEKRWKITSEGLTSIDGTYDAYLICGLGLNFYAAMVIRKIVRARIAAGEIAEDVYESATQALIEEALRNTLGIRFLHMLRQISTAPVLLVPQPSQAEDPAVQRPTFNRGDRLRVAFEKVCKQLAEECGAHFLPQRAETLAANRLYTKAEYAIGPARLAEGKAGADYSHMNSEYGAIVLRHAISLLTNAPNQDAAR